jgi:hypothetical protein
LQVYSGKQVSKSLDEFSTTQNPRLRRGLMGRLLSMLKLLAAGVEKSSLLALKLPAAGVE